MSPKAQIPSTFVSRRSFTLMCLVSSSSTPVSSRSRRSLFGFRPITSNSVSATIRSPLPLSVISMSSPRREKPSDSVLSRTRYFAANSRVNHPPMSRSSRSSRRSSMTSIVISVPRAPKKCASSAATYPPPMIARCLG